MNKTLLAFTASAALAFSVNASAHNNKGHDRHDHEPQIRARVVDVDPIYQTIRVEYPEQQCRYEESDRAERHRTHYVAPEKLLLGGLIGGVIGHELGRNHNQDAATVTGAVIGTVVAHNVGTQHYQGDHRNPPGKHCRVETRYRTEKQLMGYRVTYRYRGELYTTRMQEHPGKWVYLDVDVREDRPRRDRH